MPYIKDGDLISNYGNDASECGQAAITIKIIKL